MDLDLAYPLAGAIIRRGMRHGMTPRKNHPLWCPLRESPGSFPHSALSTSKPFSRRQLGDQKKPTRRVSKGHMTTSMAIAQKRTRNEANMELSSSQSCCRIFSSLRQHSRNLTVESMRICIWISLFRLFEYSGLNERITRFVQRFHHQSNSQ